MTKIETPMGLFKNYNQLFESICEMDSAVKKGKLYPTHPQIEGSNWSFVVFSPDMVAALYPFTPAMDSNIKKAYDEQLSLLEIYTGDYMTPRYLALTPSVNVDELKQKWCHDYCAFYNIDICETEEETDASKMANGDSR